MVAFLSRIKNKFYFPNSLPQVGDFSLDNFFKCFFRSEAYMGTLKNNAAQINTIYILKQT